MFKKISIKNPLFYLIIFVLIELLSYFSLINNDLNLIVFYLLSLVVLILSIYKLEYGLLAVFGELLIGSMGRMFVIDFYGLDLSIRMSFWLLVMLVFFGKFIWSIKNSGQNSPYLKALKDFHFKYYFLIIASLSIMGIVNGFILGNETGLILNDANGWFYYLLLLPNIVVYSNKESDSLKNLSKLFLMATIWIAIKTFWLLYVFTHNLTFASEIYFWLRKTLVGEMTITSSGWPRIFIQGQIFAALGLFFTLWQTISNKNANWKKFVSNIFFAALFAGVLLISFSRSFWLALLATIVLLLVLTWKFFSFKKMIIGSAWLGVVIIMSFGFIYLTSIFPYPSPGNFNADFAARADFNNNQEAAISSRWSLLPVLTNEIRQSPFIGQGYGKTISYVSNDPRVLEKNPSGLYTTYAFEWGYLDIWLKIGLLGLLAYLAVITAILQNAWKIDNNGVVFTLIGGIIFITVTNFFTPYLNHPLGIGIIIIGACLINKYRVY